MQEFHTIQLHETNDENRMIKHDENNQIQTIKNEQTKSQTKTTNRTNIIPNGTNDIILTRTR